MLIILALIALPGLGAWPPDLVRVQAVPVPQDQSAPRDALADRMWQALRLGDLMPVLQHEAAAEAARMDAQGLIGGAGAPWSQVVADIHDPARLQALFRAGVADAAMRADRGGLARALDFQQSDLGQRVVSLEISARHAMLEEGVEEDARQAFAQTPDSARRDQILSLIARADLVTPNVAGGLNAGIAFSRGFAQGDGFDLPPTEGQMLADAWAQRDRIEADATEWLQAFLMMAYAPLSDQDLDRYIDHAASAEGQALAQMLFAGFDRVFAQTSFQMGMAAAERLRGRRL